MKSGLREKRDIEWLVEWALLDNGLGARFSADFARLTWQDMGTPIDAGGWAAAGPRVQHEDAIRIADAITALPTEAAALIVMHGRVGDRPDWCEEGEGRLEQKRNKRGQLEWYYARPGDYRSAKTPRMVWVGETPERVRWYRARYGLWHAGLNALIDPLNLVLERFEARDTSAPAAPWEGARVFGPDGVPVLGLGGQAMALRQAALRARGPIEREPEPVDNLQAGSSVAAR